jgi:hypothetical protein
MADTKQVRLHPHIEACDAGRANFYEIKEREGTDTGRLLETSDPEIKEIGSQPGGLRRKSADIFVVVLA